MQIPAVARVLQLAVELVAWMQVPNSPGGIFVIDGRHASQLCLIDRFRVLGLL